MRISTRHKFCYIANPQCASSSIRRMFDDHSDVKSSTVVPQAGRMFKHHTSATDTWSFLMALGQDPADYVFFSSVRNPWNKMVSRYYYGLRNPASTWSPHALAATGFADFVRDAQVQEKSLVYRYEDFFFHDGRSILDTVIRVESLAADVAALCHKLGLPVPDAVHTNQNRPDGADYRTLYDAETRDIVARMFAVEIDLMGYQF